jgi:hypothetical protein
MVALWEAGRKLLRIPVRVTGSCYVLFDRYFVFKRKESSPICPMFICYQHSAAKNRGRSAYTE